MVTIVDVARMAGVSTATVSHSFSAKRPVSRQTRERVLAVAERAGYRPSHVAASMVTGRTRTIGMVVPDIANPFFSELVRGAEAAAMAAGYMTIVCSSELDAALEDRCVAVFGDKRVDALLYLPGTTRTHSRLSDPALARTPLVVIDEELDELPPAASVVTSDNEAGGALAARHLCELGHREIGVVGGPPGLPTSKARLAGFAAVLESHGIALPPERVVHARHYTRDGGLAGGRELLTGHPEITAVYCANDLIALGVVTAARECGRQVGRDLSVAGFDDIFVSQLVSPALTTVRQPIARLGGEAIRLALQALSRRGSVPERMGKLGFSAAGGIGWLATIYGMIYSFQVYTGFQWTGYFAGEIRNVRRTATTSILGALLISAFGYVVGVGLIYKYYGFNFFGASVFMALGGGSAHWTLPFKPYLPSLAGFLPGPHWLLVFIALCFVLAILWWTPTGFMLGTRNLFAWSFDRLAPEKLTTVSDRFHTPVVATVTIGCIVELLNYLNIYQGLGAYLLNIIAVMALAFIIVSIAGAAAPWLRPQLHAQGPGWAKRRVAGLPVITWAASVSALSWVFVIYVAFHTGFGGTFGFKPMVEAFTAPLIGIVYYAGARLYRHHQGMRFSQTFAEIPPE